METRFTKRFVQREPGYPIGTPAPLFVQCVCGQKVSLGIVCGVCRDCERAYDTRGYLVTA